MAVWSAYVVGVACGCDEEQNENAPHLLPLFSPLSLPLVLVNLSPIFHLLCACCFGSVRFRLVCRQCRHHCVTCCSAESAPLPPHFHHTSTTTAPCVTFDEGELERGPEALVALIHRRVQQRLRAHGVAQAHMCLPCTPTAMARGRGRG